MTDSWSTRLKEFRSTESAELSVQDFRTMWLEKEADPPAFAKARKADAKENTPDVENPVENTTNEPQQATLVENETQATSVKPQPEWEEIDELAPSPVPDTQATLVNPQLEKEMESMEKEMEEWMQDSSVKEATEALGKYHVASDKDLFTKSSVQKGKMPRKPQRKLKKSVFPTWMTTRSMRCCSTPKK